MFFHDIKQMSTRGLRAMQRSIHDRLVEEDSLPVGTEKIYGVREYGDWREQGDEIEEELDARGEIYTKVAW